MESQRLIPGVFIQRKILMPLSRLILMAMPALLVLVSVASAAPAEAGHEAATPFAGSIYQAIAAAIIFILLLIILKKMAWGPILQGLVDRENKIKNDLESAEIAAKQATATLEQYRKQLAESHAEARRIIEQGRADAEQLAAKLAKQAEDDIQGMRVRAQAEIKTAREQAVSELYAQAATLATSVASKILHRELSAADQQRLVEESISTLQQSSNN